MLPNSAMTVRSGPLDEGVGLKYLTEILEGFGQRERLASSADYQQMNEVMNKLAPGERSGTTSAVATKKCGRRTS